MLNEESARQSANTVHAAHSEHRRQTAKVRRDSMTRIESMPVMNVSDQEAAEAKSESLRRKQVLFYEYLK
ncbi:unnamed protein product [Gongylonema pulchrum]|uniref:Uncharacterized protein n=1 Tax=Gongylonema pulchrum TaxID=637853 RepID=A0A183DEM3_9BILA|nr:unnamed protein product [Gongylonema pulchrum]